TWDSRRCSPASSRLRAAGLTPVATSPTTSPRRETLPTLRQRGRARRGCATARPPHRPGNPGRRSEAAIGRAVACRAARPGLHRVLLLEARAEPGLIGRRRPGHRRDLFARPQVLLRPAVAVEAPAHGERCPLLHRGHLIDAAVAGDAPDAL